ncbi:transposase [Candidatus Halobeggiatoa sp. HSG11]|nr:transposase [Candidatus Halobeggiatoa sp. HSG11]
MTKNIYRILHKGLKKLHPYEAKGNEVRHLNTLTSFIFGIIKSSKVTLSEIASEIPNSGKEESLIMKLRRWVANENIEIETYFLPFIQCLLQSISNNTIVLVIDGSTVGRGCITLMVSVIYKKRTLPLMWVTRKGGKGAFPEEMHVEIIRAVHELIPTGCDIVVLGDGEFNGTNWLNTINEFGWHYVCRTAKNSIFYEQDERFKIEDTCPEKGNYVAINNLKFTDNQYGPITAVVWWDDKYKQPIYLVSNFEIYEEICYWYQKRFYIETMFSDYKSRGFNIT